MKKEEFLILLLARLIERGVPEDTAKKETEHVRTYLTESGMEELDISLDEMADGIISMLGDTAEEEKQSEEIIIPIAPSSEIEEGSVSDELEAAIAAIDSDSAAASENVTPPITEIPIVIEPTEEEDVGQTEIAFIPPVEVTESNGDDNADANPEPVTEEPTIEVITESDPEPVSETDPEPEFIPDPIPDPVPDPIPDPALDPSDLPQPPAPAPIDDEDDADVEEFFPYDKMKKKKTDKTEKKPGNEWLYVAILVVTIPLVIALLAISLVLYLGFWVALALAMIACIAILVVFVTAGSIVSLVGIVYGVVQLITSQIPVGMFEVGLGIIVGAATMFVGILIYNFAVRFIPFGMKLLAKLFRSGFRAVRSGYQALKGAVDKI